MTNSVVESGAAVELLIGVMFCAAVLIIIQIFEIISLKKLPSFWE